MPFAIMRSKKLKGGAVTASDKHTERERDTPNADPQQTAQNIYLRGQPGMNLKAAVDLKIAEARAANGEQKKMRKDAVQCVEFLFTATRDYFERGHRDDSPETPETARQPPPLDEQKEQLFYRHAEQFMAQLEERGFVFVKAVAHRDELTPHVAAYAVPFDPQGKLNCKYHLGGSQKLSALQDEYAAVMAPLGLERGKKGSQATHQDVKTYYGQVGQLKEAIQVKESALAIADEAQRETQDAYSVANAAVLQLQAERGQAASADIPLAEMLRRLLPPQRLLESTSGLILRESDEPQRIKALVTPDNRAFAPTGEMLSSGSSLQFLSALTSADLRKSRDYVEQTFGKEQADNAAKSYGLEVAESLRSDYTPPHLDAATLKQAQEAVRAAPPMPANLTALDHPGRERESEMSR